MKEHKGMRPQDIVILLKVAELDKRTWLGKDLAFALNISASEVSESLNRSAIAGLLTADRKQLDRKSLLELLEYGLRYVFPAVSGKIIQGIPTACSAPPLNRTIRSEEVFVWPDPEGDVRGQSIPPLYPPAVKAIAKDPVLYELLALVDAVRIAGVHTAAAITMLRERLAE